MLTKFAFLPSIFLLVFPLRAQETVADPDAVVTRVLQRLDVLESENRRLADEIHSLRQELAAARTPSAAAARAPESPAAATPTLDERVDVSEKRIAEQAQTKVESSQKFPLSIYGMLLFNSFANSRFGGPAFPNYGLLTGPERDGATIGQSILGVQFQGPSLPGNGRVNGSLTMDFWGGYSPQSGESWFRIREGDISLDWRNRSITVGQLKPLISPLQPTSLAEVAVPPLAGAGNLWLWLPQARYEERVHFTTRSGVNLQGAVLQTSESSARVPTGYAASLEAARPALEVRGAFWHKFDETRKLEIAPGYHFGSSRVAGTSVPSRITSVDWSIIPFEKLHFTGTFYHGENVASLGSLGNGFVIPTTGSILPVHTNAGWSQISVPFTSRFSWNFFGGIENDRGAYGPTHNFSYASNILYHLGPNVMLGAEALQIRLHFSNLSYALINHYDLALAYSF